MEKEMNFYKFNNDFCTETKNNLVNDLKTRIEKFRNLYEYKKIIILCIGSTKAKFDSLGPMIGSKLTKLVNNPNVKIYGTKENPIHGKNIQLFLFEHRNEIDESLTIAIDASFAQISSLGTIVISNEGIYPGQAVGKTLPYVGDFSIKGCTINRKIKNNSCDFDPPSLKEISQKKDNGLDLIYSSFCDILDSEEIISMVDIISNSLTIALEKTLYTKTENLETCKKLSFNL